MIILGTWGVPKGQRLSFWLVVPATSERSWKENWQFAYMVLQKQRQRHVYHIRNHQKKLGLEDYKVSMWSPRCLLRWEIALNQKVRLNMIWWRNNKGQIFGIYNKKWKSSGGWGTHHMLGRKLGGNWTILVYTSCDSPWHCTNRGIFIST